MEEIRDLVICNSGRRQKTRVQQLREGEAIYEVESWKASQRSKLNLIQNTDKEQSSHSDNEEKGETRDIVAKIISWGTGTKGSGKELQSWTIGFHFFIFVLLTVIQYHIIISKE